MEETKRYLAYVIVNGELEEVEFVTDGDPIEHLWERYGMSSYIDDLAEVGHEGEVEIVSEED